MAETVIDITEGAAERAELRALLTTAARGLNPAEREVLELKLRQGLEAAEVADVLGVSRSQAASLAARARDQLEACLAVLWWAAQAATTAASSARCWPSGTGS